MLLERRGFAVRCYASAEAFLRQADLDECGCILVDHHMPVVTGIELLEILRARHIAVPVVIMTGGTDKRLAGRAEKANALAVLEKPVGNVELTAWMDLALSRVGETPARGLGNP